MTVHACVACVKFRVDGVLGTPVACHCVQCREQSGYYFASANVPKAALQFVAQDQLRWYVSSAKGRRGFCGQCGSWLFWDPPARDRISIAMGAFDADTGRRLGRHIFVAKRGSCCDIADGLPQNEHWGRQRAARPLAPPAGRRPSGRRA